MESLGRTIRNLREEKELPLRTVAAYLDIDQAILSKIERGKRTANREQIVKLAEFFRVEESDLLVSWLSEKLVHEIADEEVALRALQIAEEKIAYKSIKKKDISGIVQIIKNFLKKDGRVAKAWIFGSVARGENTDGSDLDLMVRFKEPDKVSLFDYADIAYLLGQEVNMKIDLVEEGCLTPFAWENAKQDLKLIYE